MGTVNIVVPPLHPTLFSGGTYCILRYAIGLREKGHAVNLIPLLPCPAPRWAEGDYGRLLGARDARCDVARFDSRGTKRALIERMRDSFADVGLRAARLFPEDVQRGFEMRFVRQVMPPADVTVATSFQTALPVHLYGTGKLFYFLQHFEPYFAVDMPDPKRADHEARASYRLGLQMIANSTWLQRLVQIESNIEPVLCSNAIDHTIFVGEPKVEAAREEVRIISYGGRTASWKGFRDMAHAVRQIRNAIPSRKIRWLVFGDSMLPPDNQIARYESLGFLRHEQLAGAYRDSDILLSASWHESFPLFPLEAMACGLAVVTSQPGTEEFAIHEETAEIVEARNVDSIVRALTRLIHEPRYRLKLAKNGREVSRKFTWAASVDRMESLLFAGTR